MTDQWVRDRLNNLGGEQPEPQQAEPQVQNAYEEATSYSLPINAWTIRTGIDDYRRSYWERPKNVSDAYNRIQNEPDYDWQSVGINPDFVNEAWQRLGAANGGKSWWDWQALPEWDDFSEVSKGMADPLPEYQLSSPYKPDYLTRPTTPQQPMPSGADLEALPGWQKTMAFIMGNGALQGAAMALPWMTLGGISGLAVGGPIGGILGASGGLAAGFLLGFAGDPDNQQYARDKLLAAGYDAKTVDFLQNSFNSTLRALNLPAEWLEQGIGTTVQLGEAALPALPYKIFGYEDMLDEYTQSQQDVAAIMNNLPAVWEASRGTYEAAATTSLGGKISNLPAGIEWLADMVTQGTTDVSFARAGQVHVLGQETPVQLDVMGAALLQAARNEIIAGADPAKTIEKYQVMTGFSGQFADLWYQSLADPLNVIPIAERGVVKAGAKLTGNMILEQAVKNATGEGIIGTYRQYGNLLRTGAEIQGVATPQPWQMTRFQRWLADVTPDGMLKEYLPKSAATRTKRGFLTFAENPLNPISWWHSISELTPKSKLAGFTWLAQSNLGEIIQSYDDVDALVADLTKFIEVSPAEYVVLGRQFGNPEMYTVGQGMKGYGEKLKQAAGIYKAAEQKRQLLLRVSAATGEDYHTLLARIREGGDKGAATIYQQIVNKVQEAQRAEGSTPEIKAQAQEAAALLGDAMFTPDMFKGIARTAKTSPWAYDPGYFKAHLYNDMANHLETWAIDAFGVKPENAVVRSGNALKAMQSFLLLDFSPGYMLTNIAGNVTTRAAEASFGYLGPQRVRNYLDWIGHPEARVEAGVSIAGEPGVPTRQKYASVEEAYREAGMTGAMEWTAENTQALGGQATKAKDWIQKWHDKMPTGPMRKVSGKAESVDSVAVHYTWTTGTFARMWNRHGSIPRMPDGIRQSLAGIDPRLPDLIMSGIEAAKSKQDISRLLSGITETARKADPYLEGVTGSLGIDSPMTREALAKTNVIEKINERLLAGASPEDAVNSVRRDVMNIVREQQAERVKINAAAGAAHIRGEGMAAVAQSYRDAMWSHDEFWTRHFMEWERTYETAKGMAGPDRNAYIGERSKIQDQEWAKHNADMEATWHGFLRDVGFTDGNLDVTAQKFMGELAGTHRAWKQFFQERQRRVRKFEKDSANASPETRDRMWAEVQKEMGALYDQHNAKELEATRRMGEMYLSMWREQFGEANIAGAAYWWKGIYDTTIKRQALMKDMRTWERGEQPSDPNMARLLGKFIPEDRHKAWPAFLEKMYLPAIGEITQAHLDGINAVSDAATGRPGRPEWDEALAWFTPEAKDPVAEAQRDVMTLTEAERASGEYADVTRAVAEGRTPQEIAESFGLQPVSETPAPIQPVAPQPIAEPPLLKQQEVSASENVGAFGDRGTLAQREPDLPPWFVDDLSQGIEYWARDMLGMLPGKGQSIVVIPTDEGGYRQSQNPQWYKDLYNEGEQFGEPINRETVENALKRIVEDKGADKIKKNERTIKQVKSALFDWADANGDELVKLYFTGDLRSEIAAGNLDKAAQTYDAWATSETAARMSQEDWVRLAGSEEDLNRVQEYWATDEWRASIESEYETRQAQLRADVERFATPQPEPPAPEPQPAGAPVDIEQAATLDTTPPARSLDDVYIPALKQEGWTRGKAGLLKAVNADRVEAGQEPYKKASDVPLDEAMAAMRKRVPAKEEAPAPTDLPEPKASEPKRPAVTVQKYLEPHMIAGKPVVGAAYVNSKFAAYIPFRFETNKLLDTAQGPARILGINPDGQWVYRLENTGEVKTVVDGDETIPVAGPFAPGTMEANGAMPVDEAAMWADGMANYIDPVLDELVKQMKSGPALTGEGLNLGRLSVSDQANFKRWIEQVAGAQSRAKMASIRVGDMKRDMALLDYGKRYGFDNGFGLIFPYQFWFTRSMVNWAVRFADRPGMLSFFARLAQFKDEAVDEQFSEIPSRLKGKVRIPIPFLSSVAPWAGGSIYVDPWGKLFPFREFLRPWERYLQDNTRIRRKAEQYIRSWADMGEYTTEEAQQAVNSRSGKLWDRAYAEAQANEGGDAVDYLSLISSPNLALSMIVRGPEKTGPFPLSRMMQGLAAVTGWEGLANLDPEAKLRKNAKLSEYGEWGNYYIDRQLANLAADGQITAKDAQIAMIERSGPAFDMAMERVRLEAALREPGMLPVLAAKNALTGDGNILDVLGSALVSWLPGGLLPEGELALRGLSDDYSAAWAAKNSGQNPEAVNDFFMAHPEYQARLALYDEPEERLRQFMISEIWDRWGELPEPYRNAAKAELGNTFSTMFMNPETRDIDGLSVETLATWAKQLGGYAPEGTAPGYAEPMQFTGNEAAAMYDQQKEALFPGIGQILSVYYGATDEQKAMLKQQYPQIQGYYNWRDTYISQNPELIPYMAQSDPELAQADPETAYMVYMYRAEKARLFPEISAMFDEYYSLPTQGRKAYYKQNPAIGQYYDWEEQMLKQFPQIVRYVKSDQSAFKTLFGRDYTEQYGTPVNVFSWPVEVQTSLQSYHTSGSRLSSGARSYLYYQWEKSGQQLGSFERWLDNLGVYYGQ